MTATRRIRWECPNGLHPGRLGPRKPRRDDIVRYCLACSEATGRLVERTAPALQRARAAAEERARTRAAQQRQSAAQARRRATERESERYTVDGVDLRDEFKRLCRLPAFGGPNGRLARRPPTFTVTVRRERPRSQLGWASPSAWRFHLSRYPGQDLADARETLVHELAHLAAGYDRVDRRHWHGEHWRQLMRSAFRQAYGPDVVAPPNRYAGRYAAALRRHQAEQVAS